MWALQLYVGFLPNFRSPFREPNPFFVQPRDQHPATYIMTIPWATFHPGPPGHLFFITRPGTHAHHHIYLIHVHICSPIQILFTLGIWLFYVQVLGQRLFTSPLQVYIQHWHVDSPTVLHLHPSHTL
jgi:hypothetical protein